MKRLISVVFMIMFTCSIASAALAGAILRQPVYESGRTTIRWDVTGNDPGTFQVMVQPVDNGPAKQTVRDVGTTRSKSITTTECIPGKSYEITLKDGAGEVLDRQVFRMDEPITFEDGKLKNTSVKISMEFRQTNDGSKYSKIKSLKSQDIFDGFLAQGPYYGIKYTMKMPQLAKQRSFFVTLVFEAPNGYLFVEQATDVTFDRVNKGYQTLWWNLAGYKFFMDLLMNTFEIPVGEYKIHLYWDGMWMNTSTFRVS